MSSSELAVSVRGVSKSYTLAHNAPKHSTAAEALAGAFKPRRRPQTETFWALKDVNFEIAKGDVVGIVGRNGAGKSTLLKVLSRITEPTTGQIDLYGRVGSLLEVGTGFHPELTGRENVYMNGAILGMGRREIQKQFDAIVAFAEVENFLDTPVKRYSSGMYVRLAFAVAAHLNPEILIVDEVLAVGDAAFQKKCLGKMQDVSRQDGRTVLFVSHNMGAVKSLCRTALWMQGGQVQRFGPSHEVLDEYLRRTSAAATGEFDLSDAERPGTWAGEHLRLLGVSFNDGDPIRHGEPLRVRIEFETRMALEGVSLGFGFATLEGTRLMSLDTDLTEEREDLRSGCRGAVTMEIGNLQLQPGLYNLDVGARSGDFNSLDYISGGHQVEVLPGPKTPGTIVRGTGGVRVPARCFWQSEPATVLRSDDLALAGRA